LLVENTTYWFAPGVHTLGSSVFSQILPKDGDRFIGAPGAVLDGQHLNYFAFTQGAKNVTVSYLTIRNFAGAPDQFIVNHDSGTGWVVSHNTLGPNDDGAALGVGQDAQVTYNCVTRNGQYGLNGFNAAPGGGPAYNVVIDHNEFDTNNVRTLTGPSGQGCSGCGYDNYPSPKNVSDNAPTLNNGFSGGMKLWNDVHARVTNNWVHNNHGPGIWADTANIDVVFDGNYVSQNWAEGLFYEVSYNPTITNNTFVGNCWVKGPRIASFPCGAIYMSEGGYDSRVTPTGPNPYAAISGNVFTDNWDGVTLWENSNRYCSAPNQPDYPRCTLVNPTGGKPAGSPAATVTSCADGGIEPSYDCRWRTQNIKVFNNTFNLNPANITAGIANLATHGDSAASSYPLNTTTQCTTANRCGENAMISNSSSVAFWPADTIPYAITWSQGNQFSQNTYNGPWIFDAIEGNGGSNYIKFSDWQKTVGTNSGAVNTENHPAQDADSTCNGCP
jgi:parallel beta-helix repeat protein